MQIVCILPENRLPHSKKNGEPFSTEKPSSTENLALQPFLSDRLYAGVLLPRHAHVVGHQCSVFKHGRGNLSRNPSRWTHQLLQAPP